MPWQSVNDILGKLEIQAHIRAQPFQKVLEIWKDVVGDRVAAHSRPIAINRQVLRVAVSSAAWAQNLMFQRQQIIQALNKRLEQPLNDIRYSTAGWHLRPNPPKPIISLNEHPSFVGNSPTANIANSLHTDVLDSLNTPVTNSSEHIEIAFNNWKQVIQARSQDLPKCPRCQAPTPEGEIVRWGVCSLCFAKGFERNQ